MSALLVYLKSFSAVFELLTKRDVSNTVMLLRDIVPMLQTFLLMRFVELNNVLNCCHFVLFKCRFAFTNESTCQVKLFLH